MKARERKLQYTLLALLLGVCQLAASTDFEAASVESRWKAGDAGVVLTLEFPAPTSGPDAWPDLASGMELAAPPLLNRLIRIPDRSGVSVRILQQDWRSLGKQAAAQWGPVVQDADPTPVVRLGEPMILRDQRVMAVSVSPLRWNPRTQAPEYLHGLELALDFSGNDPRNQITHTMPPSPLSAALGADELIRPATADGVLRDLSFDPSPLPLSYMVFTPASALANTSFQQWLEWKFRKGHRLTVVSEEEIGWTAESIRARIQEEFQGDAPPDFVLLVGEATGGTLVTPTHATQYDHGYATVAGDDFLADLVVGRISVYTQSDLTRIFNKLNQYEQHPYLTDSAWLRRASFLSGSSICAPIMNQTLRAASTNLASAHGYTQVDTAWCASSTTHMAGWLTGGTSFISYIGWAGMEGL
ncbi:MAG: hypothetical protein KC518_14690, partial [Candidatus Cloacimonetes bacterium]|nr:hypothetical protein [Candidatus Cloacimonadota bacterium]